MESLYAFVTLQQLSCHETTADFFYPIIEYRWDFP